MVMMMMLMILMMLIMNGGGDDGSGDNNGSGDDESGHGVDNADVIVRSFFITQFYISRLWHQLSMHHFFLVMYGERSLSRKVFATV